MDFGFWKTRKAAAQMLLQIGQRNPRIPANRKNLFQQALFAAFNEPHTGKRNPIRRRRPKLLRRKSCDLFFKCLRRFSPHNRHLKPDSLPQDTRNASFFQPETVIIQSKHRCLPGRNREQGHMYDRLSGRNLELLLHMDRGSIGRSCKAADMRRICQPCIHRRGGAAFKNQEDIGLPSSREHTGQPLCYPQLLVLEQQPSPTASGFQ